MAKHDIRQYTSNLKSEELKEQCRQGGIASGEARRNHRLFRHILSDLLSAPLDTEDGAYDALRQLGISNPRQEDAIMLANLLKARTGDVEAVRFIRDTLGEKPTDTFNLSVSEKPIRSIDLTQLTDEEIEALADRATE